MLPSLVVVCLLSASLPPTFEPVPAAPGEKPSGLVMRVVKYDGSTNGSITVEVKNPTKAAAEFSAQGLFFVPNVDPDHAPQRLGAVGGFLPVGKKEHLEKLSLAADAVTKLTLDVYCIDSHRPSPTSETPFRVSKERMPKSLSHDISTSASNAAKSYGGVNAPAAKSAVQSEVWNNRDKKWIKLDGEGQQEAAK